MLRYLLCGALIGAGAILPGVSGGVLAVVFGIYRPFMEVLTHPRRALPKYWRMLIPLSIGWAAGFLGFAKGIAAALSLSDAVTTWLFIGLIGGTVPALFREAGKEGRRASSWASLLLCALAIFSGLFYVSRVVHAEVEPSFWWYNFCGVLWGMSVVIPGMTSSSIMMALGLYQPMLEGLAALDFIVLSGDVPGNRSAGPLYELVLSPTLRDCLPWDSGLCAGFHPCNYSHQLHRTGGNRFICSLLRRGVPACLLPCPPGGKKCLLKNSFFFSMTRRKEEAVIFIFRSRRAWSGGYRTRSERRT